jgi:hypothetical protein
VPQGLRNEANFSDGERRNAVVEEKTDLQSAVGFTFVLSFVAALRRGRDPRRFPFAP